MTIPVITIGADPEVFVCQQINPDKLQNKRDEKHIDSALSEIKYYEAHFGKIEKRQNHFREWMDRQIADYQAYMDYYKQNEKKVEFVSGHDLIPGTKKEPFKVPGGAIQVDGVALEFNINPAKTFQEFSTNINTVLSELKQRALKPGLDLSFSPVARFSTAEWSRIPDENKVLGCIPDFNGYTCEENPTPNGEVDFRTASGHIHLGWGEGFDITSGAHIADCGLLATQLDMTIGVFTPYWDTDQTRRKLYGKPGCFRPKSYGMEYRSPSNAWVAKPELYEFIYRNSKLALKLLFRGHYLPGMFPGVSKIIQTSGYNSLMYSTFDEYINCLKYLKDHDWIAPNEQFNQSYKDYF